ncbi:hypothetical protein TNCV_977861 [Trichonephila clavipes]|nr:hypothetical protein TNCV_977861 [Trichonephila clavipes]
MHSVFRHLLLLYVLHLRPPLATFFVEDRHSAIVSSFATFLLLPQFPQVVFSVGIGLGFSKNDASDCKNLVWAIDEPCAAVIWTKLF